MSNARYVVGIDLGTTNTALAYVDGEAEGSQIQILPLTQLVAPGETRTPELLPSFLYIPGPHELPAGSLTLPWDKDRSFAVGEFARDHGAKVGNRLISSAKSWLCHPDVDRKGAILPWGAEGDVTQISPLEASARILGHAREAWNFQMAKDDPAQVLENQHIVLTVPASFDAVARELTVEAARAAGLPSVTLLEEPQAAFYSWLESNPTEWREQVKVGDVILVCDIGGGTTDFCLISVGDEGGGLVLTRIAVGDHLLLGGDNMDLALGLAVERELEEAGKTLDPWQLSVLVHQCRQAKEDLLEHQNKGEAGLVIPGRGSSIVGGTIKAKLPRATLDAVLVEGFFPPCEPQERPDEAPQVGLQEWGLPYAPDARITRWLAKFLGVQKGAKRAGADSEFVKPTAVLFNGGVLRPQALRDKIRSTLTDWSGSTDGVRELPNPAPSLAVARGAAYYGMVRQGKGIRIRGGAARSYYIGVESARPAVPGVPTPISGLCVLPRGIEEGSSLELPQKEFGLIVGQTARFRFFSSATRTDDTLGTAVPQPDRQLHEIEPVEAKLPADAGSGRVPVKLQSSLTEMGVLELHFVDRGAKNRWKLEFSIRDKPKAEAVKTKGSRKA